MNAVCTIGLDLAKQFFQVHGVDYRGARGASEETYASKPFEILCKASSMCCWYGSLWRSASLGTGIGKAWAHSQAHARAVCEALRQDEQERPSRRGSHLRSRDTTEYALCGNQNCRATRGTCSASYPARPHQTAYRLGERNARIAPRIWHCPTPGYWKGTRISAEVSRRPPQRTDFDSAGYLFRIYTMNWSKSMNALLNSNVNSKSLPTLRNHVSGYSRCLVSAY